MTQSEWTDYAWLVGPEADEILRECAGEKGDPLRLTRRLRRVTSLDRTRLLVDQILARQRAKSKFPRAERMFFTSKGLQQATDGAIAKYKSGRFPEGSALVDLCCGIGGDAIALAGRGPLLAIDRDVACGHFCRANLVAIHRDAVFHVCRANASDVDVRNADAWHLDPDRRPNDRRVTNVWGMEPSADAVEVLLARNPDAGVKLAPAARVPDDWHDRVELEWISSRGECRQLMAWSGHLRFEGPRRATRVRDDGAVAGTFAGVPARGTPLQDLPAGLVYVPDPSLLAADLVEALAQSLGLAQLAPGTGLLTSDHESRHALLTAFETLDHVAGTVDKVSESAMKHGVNIEEIKVRNAKVDPSRLRQELRRRHFDRCFPPATLIVYTKDRKVCAILCRRIELRQHFVE